MAKILGITNLAEMEIMIVNKFQSNHKIQGLKMLTKFTFVTSVFEMFGNKLFLV